MRAASKCQLLQTMVNEILRAVNVRVARLTCSAVTNQRALYVAHCAMNV